MSIWQAGIDRDKASREPTSNYITNWHGKPIGDLSRGELVDALDWCVKELRKHNEDYHHQSPRMTIPGNPPEK